MRTVRRLAAVVAMAAAFVLLVISQRVVEVEGVASPAPGDTGLMVLTQCLRGSQIARDLDLGDVQVGPRIEHSTGDHIFGLTKDRTLIECGDNGHSAAGPLSVPPPEVKARFTGSSYVESAGVTVGQGLVAQDVARLEVVLPDGRVVEAEIAGGVFAFVAGGTDQNASIVLRAYDGDGELTYESVPVP